MTIDLLRDWLRGVLDTVLRIKEQHDDTNDEVTLEDIDAALQSGFNLPARSEGEEEGEVEHARNDNEVSRKRSRHDDPDSQEDDQLSQPSPKRTKLENSSDGGEESLDTGRNGDNNQRINRTLVYGLYDLNTIRQWKYGHEEANSKALPNRVDDEGNDPDYVCSDDEDDTESEGDTENEDDGQVLDDGGLASEDDDDDENEDDDCYGDVACAGGLWKELDVRNLLIAQEKEV